MAAEKTIPGIFVSILCFIILSGCSKSSAPQMDIQEEVLTAVNKLRREGCKCGMTPMPPVRGLKWNTILSGVAKLHVTDMVNNHYFSHISPDGSFPISRAQMAGYTGLYVGENIARGYLTVDEVVDAWKNSEDHCKAMMDSLYTEMGAAKLNDYWVLDFGRPK